MSSVGTPATRSARAAWTDSITGTFVSDSPCMKNVGTRTRSNRTSGESSSSSPASATGSPYSVTDAAAIHGSVCAKKVRRSDIPAWLDPDANSSGNRVSEIIAR
jgi:hypothetical protein